MVNASPEIPRRHFVAVTALTDQTTCRPRAYAPGAKPVPTVQDAVLGRRVFDDQRSGQPLHHQPEVHDALTPATQVPREIEALNRVIRTDVCATRMRRSTGHTHKLTDSSATGVL